MRSGVCLQPLECRFEYFAAAVLLAVVVRVPSWTPLDSAPPVGCSALRLRYPEDLETLNCEIDTCDVDFDFSCVIADSGEQFFH